MGESHQQVSLLTHWPVDRTQRLHLSWQSESAVQPPVDPDDEELLEPPLLLELPPDDEPVGAGPEHDVTSVALVSHWGRPLQLVTLVWLARHLTPEG